MTREQNEKFIRDFYACRLKNDFGKLLPFFTEDGVFEMMGEQPDGARSASISGERDGVEAFHDGLRSVVETWDWREQTIHRLLVDGDAAAVSYELLVKHTPSAIMFRTHLCDLIDLKDGLIARMVEFVDTQKVSTLGK